MLLAIDWAGLGLCCEEGPNEVRWRRRTRKLRCVAFFVRKDVGVVWREGGWRGGVSDTAASFKIERAGCTPPELVVGLLGRFG